MELFVLKYGCYRGMVLFSLFSFHFSTFSDFRRFSCVVVLVEAVQCEHSVTGTTALPGCFASRLLPPFLGHLGLFGLFGLLKKLKFGVLTLLTIKSYGN